MTTATNLSPPSAPGRRLIARILSVAGLATLMLGVCLLVPALQSASWPTAPGTIIGHRILSSYHKHHQLFQVGVSYSFRVNQATYVGKDYSHASAALPMTYPSREAAAAAYAHEPLFRDWQVGQAVIVWYDSHDPKTAVLEAGSTGLGWGVVALAAILWVIAGFQWRKAFKDGPAISEGG